jgi:hypothetical protein
MHVGKFDASFCEFRIRLIAIIFEIPQTCVHTKFMDFLVAAEKGENLQKICDKIDLQVYNLLIIKYQGIFN